MKCMTTPILEARDLRKNYGDFCALDCINLQIFPGEMFGLLGPNGAGKTTFLSLLSGLLHPSGGEVRLLGQKFNPNQKSLKSALGVVPQDLAIYGELTARENLRFFGELYGLGGAELDKHIEGILAAIGLQDRADHRAATFSGGMKRRLNLGAALVHQPQILLLDEPTTGVDPQSRNHIFEEVRRLNGLGMTILYTSHYMEEVQALCPRIGIMDHGKLIACDALENLLRQLPGSIRFRVRALPPSFPEKLGRLEQTHLREANGSWLNLECGDVKKTLPHLLALLQEEQVELSGLEMEEPNLERVFLHLTGRGLRD
jgi:ABC-2 type transport system ATP-binding protein